MLCISHPVKAAEIGLMPIKINMKILIAPLNWGLGHATRSMPIIEELRRQGAEVILASDGAAYDLLKREYPDLPIHLLPAYDIRYPFRSMVLSMAIQMPKILRGTPTRPICTEAGY